MRAGTSVGANYRAAARAKSRADLVAKLGIVEEECDEAAYWMEVIMTLKLLKPSRVAKLHVETGELLATMEKDEGGRRTRATGTRKVPVAKLDDLGVTKDQSSQWQMFAGVPCGE